MSRRTKILIPRAEGITEQVVLKSIPVMYDAVLSIMAREGWYNHRIRYKRFSNNVRELSENTTRWDEAAYRAFLTLCNNEYYYDPFLVEADVDKVTLDAVICRVCGLDRRIQKKEPVKCPCSPRVHELETDLRRSLADRPAVMDRVRRYVRAVYGIGRESYNE